MGFERREQRRLKERENSIQHTHSTDLENLFCRRSTGAVGRGTPAMVTPACRTPGAFALVHSANSGSFFSLPAG